MCNIIRTFVTCKKIVHETYWSTSGILEYNTNGVNGDQYIIRRDDQYRYTGELIKSFITPMKPLFIVHEIIHT